MSGGNMYKVAIKMCDSYKKYKRGWHASSRIRGHWLAKSFPEMDDIFYPEYFKQSNFDFFQMGNQLRLLKDYDVVVLHKTYEWELARELVKQGKKVIVDLSDPDFLLGHSDVNRAGLCLMTMAQSTVLVVHSLLMKHELRKGTDKPIYIIPDRMDLEYHKPQKKEHNEELKKLVWFGHSDNIDSSLKIYDLSDYEVRIVSDQPTEGVEFVQWTPESVNEEIIKADCVFIGRQKYDIDKWKSNNRVLTSYALKMPVAYTPEDLEKLKSREARIENAEEGYKMVTERFDIRQSVREYKQIFNKLIYENRA